MGRMSGIGPMGSQGAEDQKNRGAKKMRKTEEKWKTRI
jgi:hypothetical protein